MTHECSTCGQNNATTQPEACKMQFIFNGVSDHKGIRIAKITNDDEQSTQRTASIMVAVEDGVTGPFNAWGRLIAFRETNSGIVLIDHGPARVVWPGETIVL